SARRWRSAPPPPSAADGTVASARAATRARGRGARSRPRAGGGRAWPDLDALRHVNNGIYFCLLDLARVDLTTRSGLTARMKEAGYYGVLAAETIRFRRSLQLFQAFEVESRVIGWDEKVFALRQTFICKGSEVATAVVWVRFLKRTGGGVSPREMLALVDYDGPEVPLPSGRSTGTTWSARRGRASSSGRAPSSPREARGRPPSSIGAPRAARGAGPRTGRAARSCTAGLPRCRARGRGACSRRGHRRSARRSSSSRRRRRRPRRRRPF